jgi:site-specific DNA recombinase
MKPSKPQPSRCAVYTRKSSEDGLDQSFNSLDAQREACEAYVKSQAHEGWTLVKKQYDDGGFSGGSMERPGLQALLEDIDKGLIDIIVVYKVDRLTRSLADFAKIVEVLDAKGASFVSITQQFNTTSSMGRLTLNVLLSFAQFEREVTGERIRDKVAASKKKGMWMGGFPPLGYDILNRKLAVNEAEAGVLRSIFKRFLELGSVRTLATDLRWRNVVSKRWKTRKGHVRGGHPFSRGALYYLLRNRIYLGEVEHKGQVHQGEHPAILSRPLWTKAQARLDEGSRADPQAPRSRAGHLLTGLIFDDRGNRMSPSHVKKKNGQRYRYYLRADPRSWDS